MSVPWALIGVTAAGYAAIGVLAIGATIGATRLRRTGGRPAPGDGQAPVPGHGTGHPHGPRPPERPPPAPGPEPDLHIELWLNCGRSLVYNPAGHVIGGCECGCPDHTDYDAWLKDLTP